MSGTDQAGPSSEDRRDFDTRAELVVPEALEGERLDRAVAMLVGCSRSQAATLVADGGVEVNGASVTKVSLRLSAGDDLAIHGAPQEEIDDVLPDPGVDFGVVYEDEHVIVINKPAGLVVHPGAGNRTGTLVNGLLHRYPEIATVGDPARPGIVHRLDIGTSGLMVAARSQQAYDELVDQLASRSVHRTYSALVLGHLTHPRGVIDAPIGRSRRDPLRMTVSTVGREARTHYELDRSFDEPIETSLITCRLETGRTHQIRVHLSSIGHPVVGDDRYGGSRKRLEFKRPFLHARELAFAHPTTDEEMWFASELPGDLSALLAELN
ncbi:MAG: RluA family pseudouridine synthase [Microthrixaceae bacterium]|nr:RluA family pseudouridine synthase [Microthrixaceae bacterium]